MSIRKEQFHTFSDNRLIEVVKNARQFGYTDEVRNAALAELRRRGIEEEDLLLTGNLSNSVYERTRELYHNYTTNSGIAFVLYGALLFLKLIPLTRFFSFNTTGTIYTLLLLIGLIMYLVFFFRAFSNHAGFYKAAGKTLGSGDQLVYVFIGMPFFLFMFFFYRKQMAEEMQMVE